MRGRATRFGLAAAALAAVLAIVAASLATARNTPKTASGRQVAAAGCQLGGTGQASHIQHVIYLQFDNTHYRSRPAERRRPTSSRCRTCSTS